VVDELIRAANEDIGVAYFYCDYADKDDQTAENILASLVKQLSAQKDLALDRLLALYEDCNQGNSRPDFGKLTGVFKDLCMRYKQTFIVIDALDECEEKDRKSLLVQLEKVTHPATKVFLTSRHHLSDMHRMFGRFPQVEIKAKDSDIREFIMNQIWENDNLLELTEDAGPLKEEIASTIINSAKEMLVAFLVGFNTT
jgi:hypothetical protein